jgi:hypothetical protein
MLFKLKYLVVPLLFVAGCSTGPDLERDNVNDPKSQIFKPNINSFDVEINNDKTVSLNWTDNSGFEDGIVVAKSMGENGSFIVLDTLSANSIRYTDESKLLGIPTTYYVGAFKNGTTPIDSAQFLSAQLDFGEIQDIEFKSKGNKITLSWSSSLPYVDKFLISEKNSVTTSTAIDTVEGNRSESTFLVNLDAYSMNIIVSALLYNQNDELVIIDQLTKNDVSFNMPEISNLTLVNEAVINVTIEDNSSFDDKFIVFERSKSAWHLPYSDFIAIDTISTSGNIIIPQKEANRREYVIEGIYQDERSGLSNPLEIEIISSSPYLGENAFTSISPTSVKLTWQDSNLIENNRAPTYHFELSLYNSESGELLRHIIIPPSETQYTIENLSPDSKYEFTLTTYNSYNLIDPIAFSVQTTIEKADEFNIALNDGVDKTKILSDQELIVYNSYQYGSPGLRAYDLNTNSFDLIYDTGDDPTEYENTIIENYSITDDLELIATNRSLNNDITGAKQNYLYVVDMVSETPVYFKMQGPDSTYNDETHLLGFISDSELIYISNNIYENDAFKVYKWNFRTNETEIIFRRQEYYLTSSYLDNGNNIFIGTFESFLVLNEDGQVIQQNYDPSFGYVKEISASTFPNSFNMNIGGRLYRYNLLTNEITRLGNLSRIKEFFEVSQYNYIICRTEYEVVFLDLDTGTQIYKINDYERQIEFQNGAFLPNTDQVIFQDGGKVKIFDLISTWLTTNFNCC